MKKIATIKQVLDKLKSKKAKDYTYITIFFLVFSIFIIFAIRPSLVTAFSLRQQREDLEKLDIQYESVVSNIVANQSTLEDIRDRLYLVDEALPEAPLINKLVSDIENTGQKNSITFINLSIGEINLVQKAGEKPQAVEINIEASCTFDNLLNFIKELSNQRRLKVIKQLSITKVEGQASESAQLKVLIQIEGYYL